MKPSIRPPRHGIEEEAFVTQSEHVRSSTSLLSDAASVHSRRSSRSTRSERNTRSTLSATAATSGERSVRSTTRRRNLRKTKSADALAGYNGCMDTHRRNQIRRARSVQFACDENGAIKHQEQIIKRTKDKSLWWNKDEIEDIRDTCWVIVDNIKSGNSGRATTPIADKEARGLERYLVPSRVVTVQEHRRLVLAAYRGFAHDEDQATISKRAAKKVSRESQKLAHLIGKLDTREALRAALT
eukprot:scaffold2903_cov170-Amphora_coffeaeformis.AAC.2